MRNIINSIKNKLYSYWFRILSYSLRLRYGNIGYLKELKPKLKALKAKNIPLANLTKEEKSEIKSIWGCFRTPINFDFFRFYKTVCGSPNNIAKFCPENIYLFKVVRTLNPLKYSKTFKNKNFYPIILKGLKQPNILLNCINDQYYDQNMNIISEDEALSNIQAVDKVIIKKTSNTSGGKGIIVVDTSEIPKNGLRKYLKEMMGKHFIIQEIVKQSPKTAAFNSSSLNTFRINTLNINGHISCENVMFRHGRKGASVDNGASGGICCGLDEHGHFNGRAFDSKLNMYEESPTGIKYKDVNIPEVEKIVRTAIEAHRKYLPMMGLIGWDFALTAENEPLFIEANLGWIGIMLEQTVDSRPIFGDRTNEVIEWVQDNGDVIRWPDFLRSESWN